MPPPSGNVHAGGRVGKGGGFIGGGITSDTNNGIDDGDPPIAAVEEELLVNEQENEANGDKLFERLEKGAQENIAANYFKPKRREQLLNHVQKVTNGEF